MAEKPVIHGRDHAPGGADPVKAYVRVQDEGSPLTQRSTMNFVGDGVVATDDGTVTVVTIGGGGGGADTFPGAVATLGATNTLLGYWRLGETSGNFADTSGHADGAANAVITTVGGTALTRGATGALPAADDDKSVTFNNANTRTGDYLHAADPSPFRFNRGSGSETMTVAAWVYPLANANAFNGGIISALRSVPMGGWGLTLGWPTLTPTFKRRDPGTSSASLDGTPLIASVWSFVAATFSVANAHKLYVNGSLVATDSQTFATIPTYNSGVDIGLISSTDFASNKLFYGGVDEVTIWGSELTASDISTLYTSGGRVTSAFISAVSVTGAYSVSAGDDVVLADGTFTVTLPTAVGASGKRYTIKNTGTGTITVGRTSSQTIDGAAANVSLGTAKQAREFTSDGTGWQITAAYL